MKKIFLEYLFHHNCLVSPAVTPGENIPELRFALARLFSIRITSGAELLRLEIIPMISNFLGTGVPAPFYRGFPDSVRALSVPELVVDQYLHYYRTYGQGDFSAAGHSVFEKEVERKCFREKTEVRDFAVLTETEAAAKLTEYAEGLLAGTRPLSDDRYGFLLDFLLEYHYHPKNCASKSTAFRLLADTGDLYYTGFLMLSDVTKMAEELNFRRKAEKISKDRDDFDKKSKVEESRSVFRLDLPNRDRKLITAVIDRLIADGKINIRDCFERKARWSGLLHHIHYRTKDPKGIEFVSAMRGPENRSILSAFEKAMAESGPLSAADVLVRAGKPGLLLRNLDYLLSRCSSDNEVRSLLEKTDTRNTVMLIQLLLHYEQEWDRGSRIFTFVKNSRLKKHEETAIEARRRRTVLAQRDRDAVSAVIRGMLERNLKGRLGRVYIDPAMKNAALPLQESAGQGGFGVLNRGTRIPLAPGKKIRAFTYWEKVHDIDLSVIGLGKDGEQVEFSWRSMAHSQSAAITFSGDETSGFDGGAEFFDVDPVLFREKYPNIRRLIFCDNIFSDDDTPTFRDCVCRAGYMLRDTDDSGDIFEPRTVQSSFTVDCGSNFAYLFGLDLETNDFVWLNTTSAARQRVAGEEPMGFLMKVFDMTRVINVYDFFRMMATELTDDPEKADVAVTDADVPVGENTELIRSLDNERMLSFLSNSA